MEPTRSTSTLCVCSDRPYAHYALTPPAAGVYRPVSGGPIACTAISPTQKAAGAYHPLTPYRNLDTRSGNGASKPIGPGATLEVKVRGLGGVPALGQPTNTEMSRGCQLE